MGHLLEGDIGAGPECSLLGLRCPSLSIPASTEMLWGFILWPSGCCCCCCSFLLPVNSQVPSSVTVSTFRVFSSSCSSLGLLPCFWCLCTNKGTPRGWSCSLLGIPHPCPPSPDCPSLSPFLLPHVLMAENHVQLQEEGNMSDNTRKVTFTSIFPIWVEPHLGEPVTHFLPKTGQPH